MWLHVNNSFMTGPCASQVYIAVCWSGNVNLSNPVQALLWGYSGMIFLCFLLVCVCHPVTQVNMGMIPQGKRHKYSVTQKSFQHRKINAHLHGPTHNNFWQAESMHTLSHTIWDLMRTLYENISSVRVRVRERLTPKLEEINGGCGFCQSLICFCSHCSLWQ